MLLSIRIYNTFHPVFSTSASKYRDHKRCVNGPPSLYIYELYDVLGLKQSYELDSLPLRPSPIACPCTAIWPCPGRQYTPRQCRRVPLGSHAGPSASGVSSDFQGIRKPGPGQPRLVPCSRPIWVALFLPWLLRQAISQAVEVVIDVVAPLGGCAGLVHAVAKGLLDGAASGGAVA